MYVLVCIIGNLVDLIKSDYTHHRHPEDIAKLDIFPASPSSDSTNHCRSLCIEKTDHQNLQPMKTKHIIMTTKIDRNIFVLPCFFGTKKCFVRGGDVGQASR